METSNPSADAHQEGDGSSWSFLTNHAHVLVCLAKDPTSRLRDIADAVGITERGVFRVVNELEDRGVIHRIKEGRRNRYEIDMSIHLRHPLEAARTVGNLLSLVLEPSEVEALGLAQRDE